MKTFLLFIFLVPIHFAYAQEGELNQAPKENNRFTSDTRLSKSSKKPLKSVTDNSVRLDQILNELNSMKILIHSLNANGGNTDAEIKKSTELKKEYITLFEIDGKLSQTYHIHFYNKFKKELK